MQVVEGVASVSNVDAFVETLSDVGQRYDCVVQAFDARLVADRAHVETALRYAARAHRRGDAIARDPAVEVLLYAAGRRQIDRAFAMGVDEGETPTLVVVASDFPDAPVEADDTEQAAATAVAELLEDGTTTPTFESTDADRLCEFFDVGDAERDATDAALADLVRERVVLLSIDH